MPIEVDTAERLDRIAEATLRLAGRGGPAAVTIRAVAAEFGGSAAVVTNYLGTREQLLLNAIQYAQRGWRADMAAHIAGHQGLDRLRALALWSCGTVDQDLAVRRLWLGMASRSEADGPTAEALRSDANEHREMLRAELVNVGATDPESAADTLYLALRGFYFASVEDPELWTSARAETAISRLVDQLVGDV